MKEKRMTCKKCDLPTWRGLCPSCDELVYDMELENLEDE